MGRERGGGPRAAHTPPAGPVPPDRRCVCPRCNRGNTPRLVAPVILSVWSAPARSTSPHTTAADDPASSVDTTATTPMRVGCPNLRQCPRGLDAATVSLHRASVAPWGPLPAGDFLCTAHTVRPGHTASRPPLYVQYVLYCTYTGLCKSATSYTHRTGHRSFISLTHSSGQRKRLSPRAVVPMNVRPDR